MTPRRAAILVPILLLSVALCADRPAGATQPLRPHLSQTCRSFAQKLSIQFRDEAPRLRLQRLHHAVTIDPVDRLAEEAPLAVVCTVPLDPWLCRLPPPVC